jgi:hypothetical protein
VRPSVDHVSGDALTQGPAGCSSVSTPALPRLQRETTLPSADKGVLDGEHRGAEPDDLCRATSLLASIALIAMFGPALRAGRTDPLVALRRE